MYKLRMLRFYDLKEIYSWENHDLWTFKEFKNTIETNTNLGLVTTYHNTVAGYILYQSRKSIKVLRILVRPEARNKKIGSKMINLLKCKLDPVNRNKIEIYLKEEDLDRQLFFARQGFIACEIISGYFGSTNAYYFKYLHDWSIDKVSKERISYNSSTSDFQSDNLGVVPGTRIE